MDKSKIQITTLHILVGVLTGVLFLHPITMAIYWFEFRPEQIRSSALSSFIIDRMAMAFAPGMLPMTGVFALIGGLLGLGSGIYSRAFARKVRLVTRLERELGKGVGSLIDAGESETAEFKASARWDHAQGKVSRDLEMVIVKTIAGFLNHSGGNLLIGVTDKATVEGLARDYATLRKKNRDGFEQLLMRLVKSRVGGDMCSLLHVVFHQIDGKDVCRVLIEPSHRPVYVQHNGKAHYFLRTGNVTAELDIKEALEHVAHRWPKR